MSSPNSPFKKQEVDDYECKRYRGWDQRLVDWREKHILKKIMETIGASSGLGLDIPSGYGRFSELFLSQGMALVSSDLSIHMVKRSIERVESNARHFGVVADAKKGLPFQKEAFSVLLSMRFFHHLHEKEDREFVLREFATVSRGWVVISFYRRLFLHRVQRKLRRKIKKTKTRISMISKKELLEEITRAGLEAVDVHPLFKGIHAQHFVLLRKVKT